MKEFLEVVDCGSISAAARQLGVPRATLSRRITGLEADLSVRLVHRRTNRLVLTAAGEELYRRAKRVVLDADAAWTAVRRLDDTPRGLLRVSVTGPHFLPLFTKFLSDFPEVQLEVQATTRHVDLLAEGVDVAIRIGEIKDQELIARQVHTDRSVVVGAPAYLNTHGTPTTSEDLAHHDCIVGFAGDWAPSRSWPLLSGGSVDVSGRLAANAIDLARSAAVDGHGLALMPTGFVADELGTGELIAVLTGKVGAQLPISIVYTDRDFIEPKVRIFVDRAVEAIRTEMPKPYPIT